MTDFSIAPLPLDGYSRYVVEAFDERKFMTVPKVFQAFFGRPETGAVTLFSPDAAAVDIDIVRGNERLAALIPRGINVRMLDIPDTTAERFTSVSRAYPLIEDVGNIDGNQLLGRRPGEASVSNLTRLDRLRSMGLSIHQESIRRIARLFEYLAAQSILTGKMPAIMGTTNTALIYDFLRPVGHAITVGTEWDKAASVPLSDIDAACALIRANGHATADMLLMGTQVADALATHTTVATIADNLRYDLIQYGAAAVPPKLQRFVDGGAICRGRLRTPGGNELWMFTYLDVYTDEAGDPTPYMPVNKALVAASSARCDRYFGPPEGLPNVPQRDQLYQQMFGFSPAMAPLPPGAVDTSNIISPAMFYADAYVDAGWKRVVLRTQAAPIFATTQTDAFVTLQGLITV